MLAGERAPVGPGGGSFVARWVAGDAPFMSNGCQLIGAAVHLHEKERGGECDTWLLQRTSRSPLHSPTSRNELMLPSLTTSRGSLSLPCPSLQQDSCCEGPFATMGQLQRDGCSSRFNIVDRTWSVGSKCPSNGRGAG